MVNHCIHLQDSNKHASEFLIVCSMNLVFYHTKFSFSLVKGVSRTDWDLHDIQRLNDQRTREYRKVLGLTKEEMALNYEIYTISATYLACYFSSFNLSY